MKHLLTSTIKGEDMLGKLIGYDSKESCFIFEIEDRKTALKVYESLKEKYFHPILRGKTILINWRIDYHGWLSSKLGEDKLIKGYHEYCEKESGKSQTGRQWVALRSSHM